MRIGLYTGVRMGQKSEKVQKSVTKCDIVWPYRSNDSDSRLVARINRVDKNLNGEVVTGIV